MNTTEQNKSISATKTTQENVFLHNWKAHAKVQALLKEKKLSPEKVTYVPLAPSHSIMDTCYIKDVEDKIPDKNYKEMYMYVNNSHKIHVWTPATVVVEFQALHVVPN